MPTRCSRCQTDITGNMDASDDCIVFTLESPADKTIFDTVEVSCGLPMCLKCCRVIIENGTAEQERTIFELKNTKGNEP